MFYGQNFEDKIVSEWFGNYTGIVLEVGANDGKTYSNSLHFIEKGWGAVLVEPSEKVFPKLVKLHQGNNLVLLINAAIGNHNGPSMLFDSGDFLLKGTCSLLSTLKKDEIKRWGDVTFEETEVDVITFDTLLDSVINKRFDFISVDCEGYDLEVLRQIDLAAVGCRCLCIEHNSFPNVLYQIKQYCSPLGFKQIGYNAENVILVR